jgi:hypothetical protein
MAPILTEKIPKSESIEERKKVGAKQYQAD